MKFSKKSNSNTFYELALGEYGYIWYSSPLKLNSYEMKELAYYRAIKSFYITDPISMEDRQSLLYYYLEPNFNTSTVDCPLVQQRWILPADTKIPKILNNLCSLYKYQPRRNFGILQDSLSEMYKNSDFDLIIDNIYRYAKLLGTVAVRPLIQDGELKFKILTPDECRVVVDDNNPDKVLKIVYPAIDADEVIFIEWTSELCNTYKDQVLVKSEPHNYGKIPFLFLKFNQNSSSFFNNGLFDLVDAQLFNNTCKWYSSMNLIHQSLPVRMIINGVSDVNTVVMPSETIIINNNSVDDTQPQIEYASPAPIYSELADYMKTNSDRVLTEYEIPLEDSGTPSSGIARAISRQGLMEQRVKDIAIMTKFETNLAKLVNLVISTDSTTPIIPKEFEFKIDYDEPTLIEDRESEITVDRLRLEQGIISPLNYYQKWGDWDSDIDSNTLLADLKERAELLKQVTAIFKLDPVTSAEPATTDTKPVEPTATTTATTEAVVADTIDTESTKIKNFK